MFGFLLDDIFDCIVVEMKFDIINVVKSSRMNVVGKLNFLAFGAMLNFCFAFK